MVKQSNIFNNFNIPKKFKNSIILIGNFDGLHLGHQKLFQLAKKYKAKYKSKIGVVTFDPIPKMFFNKQIKNYRLSNFNQKVILLNKFGVDFVAGLFGFDVPTGGQPPLARGRNFGGRNPNFETQTVDATGSLAVAGTGGNSSVNVFNMGGNVVDASSRSESHTHTNTNITDVEAENTGL